MKDLFSRQSGAYATYRPSYPDTVFSFLMRHVAARDAAWDCATGSGQVAVSLAARFKTVQATDISESQLSRATRLPNVRYSLQAAESTDFPDRSFDLITVGQAVHWFDFDRFYAEVRRTACPGGLLAILGYGFPTVNEPVDDIRIRFVEETLEGCWDPERKYIDEGYRTIPFPFTELDVPALDVSYSWDAGHYIGFLNSWSSVQHFRNRNGFNPVDGIEAGIRAAWPAGSGDTIRFPVLFRAGRVA